MEMHFLDKRVLHEYQDGQTVCLNVVILHTLPISWLINEVSIFSSITIFAISQSHLKAFHTF